MLVKLTLRFDLPRPGDGLARDIARHALSVMAAQGFTAGVAVGYGPGRLATPVADALRYHAGELGFRLADVLRAEDGRYFSYLCTDPACCPADGVPYDIAASPVTVRFAAIGAPPVLARREELAASLAPVGGHDGIGLDIAAGYVAADLSTRMAGAGAPDRKAAGRLMWQLGPDVVREALDAYRGDREIDDADAIRLSVLLSDLRVRDDAWARSTGTRTRGCGPASPARPGRGSSCPLRRYWRSWRGSVGTGRSPTWPWTGPWTTPPATAWPYCCGRSSAPGSRRPGPRSR